MAFLGGINQYWVTMRMLLSHRFDMDTRVFAFTIVPLLDNQNATFLSSRFLVCLPAP
jgi:hypothetical protein